jgi:hypothetical protein
MKTLLFAVAPLLIIGMMAGCSIERSRDNGGGHEIENQIRLDGQPLGIAWGGMVYWGATAPDTPASLTLILAEQINEGNTVEFEMFLPTGHTRLVAGTYTLSETSHPAMTYAWGDVFVGEGADYNDPAAYDYFKVTGGTVEVDLSGSTHTITFDCTLDNGQQLTGSWEGVLLWEDWSVD